MTDEPVIPKKLNNRQKLFVEEYLACFNASEAARRAGYNGASDVVGPRLLVNVGIQEAIKKRIDEKAMSADEVLVRLADIARGDIADLMAVSTMGFTLELMTEDESGNKVVNPKTKLIKKIRQRVTTFIGKKNDDEDREVVDTEIELYSASDALALLGKYHKLFVDRTELTGADGQTLRVEYVNTPYPSASLPPGASGYLPEPKEV
jgi:phage terminase small subunit